MAKLIKFDDDARRALEAGVEQAGRRRQGHHRPQGPQRGAREEVRRPHHHQRRCVDRPRGRARRPVREHGCPAREGGGHQDQRHRWRRHHHRHRAGPGAGQRGPPQRGRRRQPAQPQAGHREGRRGRREGHREPGQGDRRQVGDRPGRLHLRRRPGHRRGPRRRHRQGRQGRRRHHRGVEHLRHGARVHRGHAVRQGLPVAVLRVRRRAAGGGARRPVHPVRQRQDLARSRTCSRCSRRSCRAASRC